MLYDVVLHVGEGPGFGHNTRMLAISQYALKEKASVCVTGPGIRLIDWPVPFHAGKPKGAVHIMDGGFSVDYLSAMDHRSSSVYHVVDTPYARPPMGGSDDVGVIVPHPFDHVELRYFNGPMLVGEQYYPIREEFTLANPDLNVGIRGLRPIGYRLPERYRGEYRDLAEENLPLGDTIYFMGSAPKFICPPSVVAYECFTLGTRVMLHDEVDPEVHSRITDALVAKGFAERMDPKPGDPVFVSNRKSPKIDGLGAQRILRAIL